MLIDNQKIVVRYGTLEDLGAVVRIENRSFTDPWSLGALCGEIVPDQMRIPLVAEFKGEICGYLMAWKVVDQLHILNIATATEYRRQGVGTLLLYAAAELAEDIGLLELTLEVRRSNTSAISFYLLHGFGEVGVRPGYYPDTGEDALIMNCLLSDLTDYQKRLNRTGDSS